MNPLSRWKTSFKIIAPGLAVALALGIWTAPAVALTLGRVVVLSALGEPLNAEIEVLDISNEEAASLAPKPAAPDAYRTSGLEYSPALDSLQISLQRRANGQHFLQLRNSRPINEPYLDLIIEAAWSSGRLVRDYTMLFDPPGLTPRPSTQQLAQSRPVAPPVAPAAAETPALPAPELASVPSPAATAEAPATSAAAATPAASATAPAPAAPKPKPKPEVAAPAKSAPAAAARSKTASAKPAAQTAKRAVPPPADESTRPAAPPGQLNVIWGDTASEIALAAKPANVSLDQMLIALLQANPHAFVNNNVNRLRAGAVLTLPPGIQAEAVPRDEARRMVVAQSRDFDEYRRRLAGLAPASRQAASGRESGGSVQTRVEDRAASAPAADQLTLAKPSDPAAASADQLAAERNAQEAESRSEALAKSIEALQKLNQAAGDRTPMPVGDASAPQPESKPLPGLDVPAAAPVTPSATPPAPPTAAETARGWIERLTSGPWAAAAGILAVALAIAVLLNRRSRKGSEEAAASPEAAAQADAGALEHDILDDVDPVAEADIYLSAGRDLQAEEILKTALAERPERLAIHAKLAQIYAQRADITNLTEIAESANRISGGNGPEWDEISTLGRELDPANPLYQINVDAFASMETPAQTNEEEDILAMMGNPAAEFATETPADDIKLDFSTDAAPLEAESPAEQDPLADLMAEPEAQPATEFAPASEPGLTATESADAENAETTAGEHAPMEFDLSSLSLDLGSDGSPSLVVDPSTESGEIAEDDPLAIKLDLAQQFREIGDTEGARALIEEIIAEAEGEMKARAEQALADLG